MIYYRQCRFQSPTEDGYTEQVAWIPENLAVEGKQVYFGKKTDTPDRLWTVMEVGTRMTEDYVKAHERDYKTQREASDI